VKNHKHQKRRVTSFTSMFDQPPQPKRKKVNKSGQSQVHAERHRNEATQQSASQEKQGQ
jgi:hypothetical protein